jgi:hypothetical protein
MKGFRLFAVLLLGVVLLSACAPAAAGFVELPEDVRIGIGSVVLVVASWLIARLVLLLPFLRFLEDFRVPLAAAIATQLIDVIQNAVPDAYGEVAVLALKLVLAVLALFLTFDRLRLRGVRAFQ